MQDRAEPGNIANIFANSQNFAKAVWFVHSIRRKPTVQFKNLKNLKLKILMIMCLKDD